MRRKEEAGQGSRRGKEDGRGGHKGRTLTTVMWKIPWIIFVPEHQFLYFLTLWDDSNKDTAHRKIPSLPYIIPSYEFLDWLNPSLKP